MINLFRDIGQLQAPLTQLDALMRQVFARIIGHLAAVEHSEKIPDAYNSIRDTTTDDFVEKQAGFPCRSVDVMNQNASNALQFQIATAPGQYGPTIHVVAGSAYSFRYQAWGVRIKAGTPGSQAEYNLVFWN